MIDIDEQKKIAVLIDADNTPVNKLRSIIQEVAVYGLAIAVHPALIQLQRLGDQGHG